MTFRRPLSIALSIVALALAACGDDDEEGPGFVYTDDGRLQVMTRNLYLGADLQPAFQAQNATSFIQATTAAWSAVTANDFRVRAGALASEIAAARPDLVGLQEVYLWRTQTPGDAATGGTSPATTVAFDFLATLQGELAARGLPYVVAKKIELLDFEAPVVIGTTATDTMDVRLTDRQVILAISGLPTTNPRGEVFSDQLEVTVMGTPVQVLRGWTAVDATVDGKKIPFYNAHLEAYHPGISALQGAALHARMDAEAPGTTVVVGDFNSDPLGPFPQPYEAVRGSLVDLWTSRNPSDQGFTCCFDPILTQTTTALDERIDHILFRGALGPVSATRVGEELADMVGTPPRRPSDHAGVVGVFDP